MVKIKTKKKMTLPELIQWGWDNKAIGRFEGDKGSLVLFDANSWVVSDKFVCSKETFEVEVEVKVEEEIDEDTKIPTVSINSECLHGTTIPIDGLVFKTQKELNNFLNKVYKNYPNLTSEQWRAVLVIAFDGLAIGFADVDNKSV